MKKLIALILAFVLCFGLCACSSSNRTELGSQFIGTYEDKYTLTEYYSGWGYNNLTHQISCKETLILNGGGTGTFKAVATSSGEHYQSGDVVQEGTVQWTCDGDYITITFSGFSYNKDYGKNTTKQIDYSVTYEKKAGTLHNASSGNLVYTKVG